MQEASDWVGVILVAVLAAILYGVSILALWALGPAIALTLVAGALLLDGRAQHDKQNPSRSESG